MVQRWKKTSEKVAFANRWRQFDLWDMQREDGQTGEFVIERGGDVVIVFAMTGDQRVLTIQEFYFAPQQILSGLVAGLVKNNNPEETAKMELREETGYASDHWKYLGARWIGKYAEGKVHIFLAESIYSAGDQELETTEDIKVEFNRVHDIVRMLRAGRLPCNDQIMAAYIALDHLKLLSYE